MPKLGLILVLIPISIFQCSSQSVIGEDATGTDDNLYLQPPISVCGLDGYTQSGAEHIIDKIEQTFVVGEIHGNIINSHGYGRTKDVRVLFEIRGIKDGLIKKTYAYENGNFGVKNVPDGQYCFKATVLGWQSVMGIIIIDKNASPKNKIVFKMMMGI